jgi:hypothetical protein
MATGLNSELQKFVSGRQKQLESQRVIWEQEWQSVAELCIPIREDIYGTAQSGSRQGSKIYDGTAVGAAQLFADGMHGYNISPALQWFKLQMSKSEISDMPEVREWLQDVESRLYSALTRSNFYDASWMYLYDGGTIGTASMYMEEDISTGRISFESIHPGECYIAEDRYGNIDIYHRKRKLTARQAIQMFGENGCPDAVKIFIHAVFPREERDDRKADAKNKKYASVWLQGQHVCKESGYAEFPYSVWRYSKSGKEAYGRSPAMLALADIKGLNLIAKSMLAAAQLAVEPPLNVPAELRGKVQMRPRGMNYYDSDKRVISPIQLGTQYPIGIDREQNKQKIIENHFHVDFFLMLARSEGSMTATEVMERQGEKAAVLGAATGRLNSEGLDKIIDRVFNIELEAGRLPQPPDILLEMGGEPIEVVYMGPLAQAQRRLFKTAGIRQGLETALPFMQAFPEAAVKIDAIKTMEELLEASGFPQKCMRTDEMIKQINDAKAEQAQQMQQQEQMAQVLQGAESLSKTDKNLGNILSKSIAGGEAGAAVPEMANAPA